MREAFDVGEAELELWLQVENALGLMFYAETFGNFAGALVGAGHIADWSRGEHISIGHNGAPKPRLSRLLLSSTPLVSGCPCMSY